MSESPFKEISYEEMMAKIPNYAELNVLSPTNDLEMESPPIIKERHQRTKLHRRREADNRELKKVNDAKEKSKKHPLAIIYGTQLGVSLGAGVLTASLLYVVNPPLSQKARTDPYTSEKQDWKKVLLITIIVMAIRFVKLIYEHFSKKK